MNRQDAVILPLAPLAPGLDHTAGRGSVSSTTPGSPPALAEIAESPRARVEIIGRTHEGRPIPGVVVASPIAAYFVAPPGGGADGFVFEAAEGVVARYAEPSAARGKVPSSRRRCSPASHPMGRSSTNGGAAATSCSPGSSRRFEASGRARRVCSMSLCCSRRNGEHVEASRKGRGRGSLLVRA